MIDPNFDPLSELEHHAAVLHHHARQIDLIIKEIQRLDGLISEMASNQMQVTELLLKNQNAIKFLNERIDAIN